MRRLTLHIPSMACFIVTCIAGSLDLWWPFIAAPALWCGGIAVGIEYEAKKQGLL